MAVMRERQGPGMDQPGALKAVLFDFDGTLVRLNADFDGLRRELQKLLEPYGFHSSFKPLFQAVAEAEAYLGERHGAQVALGVMARVWETFLLTEMRAVERAELLPGVPEVWQWLRERKVPTGIVSNNHSDAIMAIMNRLALRLPEAIVGREQVHRFKPDPEALRLALSKLGLGSEGVWMVGDSVWDAEAGAALNLHVALVASPWHEPVPSQDDQIHRLERIDGLIAIWRTGPLSLADEGEGQGEGFSTTNR